MVRILSAAAGHAQRRTFRSPHLFAVALVLTHVPLSRLRVRLICAWVALALLATAGCATAPYTYGHFHDGMADEQQNETASVEYGKPNKTLDTIGKIVGFPAKILPMNSKINDHEITPATEKKLQEYLARNDLTDIAVYINHYDPNGQWRRLRDNKRIGAGWRYSLGAVSVIGYTVFPGRIFGGDRYNPFTNSLYLNSDVPALVLREAAYGKDVHSHKMPGTYAAIQEMPFLGLWSDTRAVKDVVGYARAQGDWETEKEAYHVLFPQMGAESTSVGGVFVSSLWWGGPVLGIGGAAIGHVAGRTVAKQEEAKRDALAAKGAPPADATPTAEASAATAQPVNYLAPTGPPGEEPRVYRLPLP
ncbi:MAG TPA: hypothetical protein VGN12_19170 [Pirellulales bacterium]